MKNEFAFGKLNFILLAIGMAIVIIGMVLMSGSGSTSDAFNPDIFSLTNFINQFSTRRQYFNNRLVWEA